MYNNERVIIDTRKYDIDEMLFRYKQGKIIFYEKKCATWKRREKVVQDIIKALLRGIPFPPVYASELQTGELLILDKSDKLRFLLEYLAHGDVLNDDKNVDYDRYWERTILYSTAMLYVIDYMNPRYMHMQVGKFVEEWTAMQEQSVWNVLYHGDDINILKYMIKEARHYRFTKLNLQYYLVHYLMVDFVVCDLSNEFEYERFDRFQLLEKTLNKLEYKSRKDLKNLSNEFNRIYFGIYQNLFFKNKNTEEKMKYLCFMYIYEKIYNKSDIYAVFNLKDTQNRIENWDMSYKSIRDMVKFIEKGNRIYD